MPIVRATFGAMASSCEIVLDSDDESRARRAIDAAVADVRRIEAKYSRYRDDSVTSRINAAAGRGEVAIDAETASLLRYADHCHAISGGRFDITSGVLRRAWDFRRDPPALPAQAAVDELMERVGWDRVRFDDARVRLALAGMEIDFGGIGKEYAADRASTILHEHGERHGFVNLGGDVRLAGPRADGGAWRVGIANPRPSTGAAAAVAHVDLAQGALATSGDSERFVEIGGRRYCHILDARTGWPVDAWRSVSVAAPLCVVAGSLATIAMLMRHEAAAFLDGQQASWLGIDADGATHGTLVPVR
jgi:FAD:protein FMN transferase